MTSVCSNILSASCVNKNNNPKIKHVCDLSGCTKKLTLVDLHRVCKCSKRFCDQHRCFELHNCDFVYQREENAYQQTRCVRQKVDII